MNSLKYGEREGERMREREIEEERERGSKEGGVFNELSEELNINY